MYVIRKSDFVGVSEEVVAKHAIYESMPNDLIENSTNLPDQKEV